MDIDEKNYCARCMREIAEEGVCPHCGYDPKEKRSTSALEQGTLLNGRYQLGAVIGRGGFGITYAAWDEILGVPVAVKEYFPVDFCTRNTELSDEVAPLEGKKAAYLDGLLRFQRESHLLAELQGIPNIVKVLDFFPENGTTYITMEYIHGVPLDEWVREKRLGAAEILKLVRPAVDALVQTHRQGVLHRDLTPGNMLVCGDGTVKLIDFGSAAELERSGGTVVLTRKYAAVEQYGREHGAQGPWTDVYGIAAVLYALLTGTEPQESVLRIYGDEMPSTRRAGVRLKKEQHAAMAAALAVDPAKRMQSMEEFRARMYHLPLPQEIIRHKRTMRRLGIAAVLILLIAAVLLANFSIGLPLSDGLLLGLRADGWHITGTTDAKSERKLPESVLGIAVTAVDGGAFREDGTLETMEIPGNIRSIGDTAFYGCPELNRITLREGVREIGVAGFASCPKLETAELPESLGKIPEDMLSGASEDLLIWGKRGSGAEDYAAEHRLRFADGSEMDFEPTEGGLMLTRLESAAADLVIPSFVDGVPVVAILEDHSVPVDPDVPWRVEFVEGVHILKAVRLELPEHLRAVPAGLCEGSRVLKEVVMGPEITEIGDNAFHNCVKLAEVSWPASLRTVGESAFQGCDSLRELALPEGTVSIGKKAFAYCDALEKVTLPDSLAEMGEECFNQCLSLGSIRLPETLKVLPKQALYETALTSLHLPDGLEEIGEHCFTYTPLEYLMIPESVRAIGSASFYGCENLRLLVILNDGLEVTGDRMKTEREKSILLLWQCSMDLRIAGRAGSAAQRLAEENGFAFEDMDAWDSGFLLRGDTAVFRSGMAGDICVPWYNTAGDCPVLRTEGCADTQARSVRLPLLETEIGEGEFAGCGALEEVILTGTPERIGANAFLGCSSLRKFELKEGLREIGESAFRGCALEEAVLPDTLEHMDKYAFSECTSLRRIRISRNLKVLKPYVFYQAAVEEVTVPAGVWQLNMYCFGECARLERITLEEGVKRLDGSSFRDCDALETVVLPASVYYIGGDSFKGIGLKDVWVYNPDMIFDAYLNIYPSIEGSTPVIHGYAGSTAERYAAVMGYPFEPLESPAGAPE